jgi:UDP-N-acetylglucosamine 2-epimerase (non-hydrolysing)
VSLLVDARFVMADSGGVQEETTAWGVSCLTLRENTERPITVELGTHRVIGTHPDRLAAEPARLREPRGRVPPLWDGQAARRIGEVLRRQPARPEAVA